VVEVVGAEVEPEGDHARQGLVNVLAAVLEGVGVGLYAVGYVFVEFLFFSGVFADGGSLDLMNEIF